MAQKPLPPKETYVKSREEIDKFLSDVGEGIKHYSQVEYVAFMQNKYDEALVAREKRTALQSQINALTWVTTEEKKK